SPHRVASPRRVGLPMSRRRPPFRPDPDRTETKNDFSSLGHRFLVPTLRRGNGGVGGPATGAERRPRAFPRRSVGTRSRRKLWFNAGEQLPGSPLSLISAPLGGGLSGWF